MAHTISFRMVSLHNGRYKPTSANRSSVSASAIGTRTHASSRALKRANVSHLT